MAIVFVTVVRPDTVVEVVVDTEEVIFVVVIVVVVVVGLTLCSKCCVRGFPSQQE